MKKEFKKLMKQWESLCKSEEKVSDAIKKWNKDFNYLSLGIYHDLISKLFKIAFNDKYDYIDYYAFELDFGKEKWGKTDKRPIRTLDHVWRELERDDINHMAEIKKEKDLDKYHKEVEERNKHYKRMKNFIEKFKENK